MKKSNNKILNSIDKQYCLTNCLFYDKDKGCILDKCLYSSYIIKNNQYCCVKRRRNKSFLYDLSTDTFFKLGYKAKNIKKAANMLGVSESLLKWFLYNIDTLSYKDNDNVIRERVKRICAFFDGHNEARKDKIKKYLTKL